MYVVYNSNNSGGGWWLKDEDWSALEKAGWIVQWVWLSPLYTDEGNYVYDDNGPPKLVPASESNSRWTFNKDTKPGDRWLGALAKTAYRVGVPLRAAVDEWESLTGKSSTDAGCPCCGQPHTFTEYDDAGKWVKSGPEASYVASWAE